MATGRLVFWPITNGHTAGLNRASFLPWAFSPDASQCDKSGPETESSPQVGPPPEVDQNNNNPQMSKVVCVFVSMCSTHTHVCVCVSHWGATKNDGPFASGLVCLCARVCDKVLPFPFFRNCYFCNIVTFEHHERTLGVVFMLQSSCSARVATRQRHIDIPIHNNATQPAKELKLHPGERDGFVPFRLSGYSLAHLIGSSRFRLL